MSKRFLFSTKANLATQSVLKGLSQARLATVITYALVITEDDRVAALLEQLDTAEQIVGAEAEKPAIRAPNTTEAIIATPARTKITHAISKERIECSSCHRMVVKMAMTKKGICKNCNRRQIEAAKSQAEVKSQAVEKSSGQWTSAMPQSDGHHQEHLAELQIRPKEKINLNKLSGKRLG